MNNTRTINLENGIIIKKEELEKERELELSRTQANNSRLLIRGHNVSKVISTRSAS